MHYFSNAFLLLCFVFLSCNNSSEKQKAPEALPKTAISEPQIANGRKTTIQRYFIII